MSASTDEHFYGLAMKVASGRGTPAEQAELNVILAADPARAAEFQEVKENTAFALKVVPQIYLDHVAVAPLGDKYRQQFHEHLAKVLGPAQAAATELTVKQMGGLLLKILSERPMDGVDLTRALSRAGFRLKGEGEGLIYGILANLESSREIEGRWRESSSRMVKTYYITETGSGVLRRQLKATSQLNAWAHSILSSGLSDA